MNDDWAPAIVNQHIHQKLSACRTFTVAVFPDEGGLLNFPVGVWGHSSSNLKFYCLLNCVVHKIFTCRNAIFKNLDGLFRLYTCIKCILVSTVALARIHVDSVWSHQINRCLEQLLSVCVHSPVDLILLSHCLSLNTTLSLYLSDSISNDLRTKLYK